ncbi:MAG: NUDIX hydrolase [Actinomycetota bacterium]|nr:NUDIX hydrolase [Actinomycetota bacterium]
MSPEKETYTVLDSRELARGGFLTFVEERFTDPDGEVFTRWVVRHPGAVVAVALVDGVRGPEAVCVRQFRAAVRRNMLELPAGKLDVEGENPDAAMARELAEEIGRRPGRLVKLASFWNSPGFCTELTHVYLALDLEECEAPEPAKAEERHMTIEAVPLADIDRLIAATEIADAKTIIGLCLADRYLRSGGTPSPGRSGGTPSPGDRR